MTVHELKCWPEYFEPVRTGLKPWEFRLADRSYAVGDVLRLREWSPDAFDEAWREEERLLVGDPISRPDVWDAAHDRATAEAYTGRVCERRVTYIAQGGLIPPGYVVMTLAEEPTP